MADQVGARHDNGTPVYWIEEGTGKPYTMGMVNGKPTGKKVYLSPAAMDPYTQDKGPYRSNALGGGSQWNAETGQWDKKSRNLEYLTLGAALAPFGAAAIGGFGGGGGPLASTPGAQAGYALTPGGAGAAAGSALPALTPGVGLAAGGNLGGAGTTAAVAGGGEVARRGLGGWKDSLVDLGLDTAGGLLGGLGESLFGQHRNSFSGTDADPTKLRSAIGPKLDEAYGRISRRGAPDVGDGPGPMPTFTGGGMPMPIGLMGQVQRRAPEAPQSQGGPDDKAQLMTALGILKGRR